MTPSATGSRMLFVCTGNLCRSPYAEYLARSLLRAESVSVRSAGTRAAVGAAPPREILDGIKRWGGDGSEHRAHQIVRSDVDQATVILTAGHDHVRSVVRLSPTASRRVFTIRQFRRLLDAASASGHIPRGEATLAAFVDAANAARGLAPAATGSEDIADPWGGSTQLYEDSMTALSVELHRITAVLASVT